MALGIKFTVSGDEAVEHQLLGMSRNFEDASPVLHDILKELRRIESDLFESEDSWEPLAESTLASKSAAGFSSRILQATETLRRSLTEESGLGLVTQDELHFGTSVPYAKYHRTGTRNMPKRDPLQIKDSDMRRFSKMVQAYIVGGERSAFGTPSFGSAVTTPFGV